jgi:hypothetical protein
MSKDPMSAALDLMQRAGLITVIEEPNGDLILVPSAKLRARVAASGLTAADFTRRPGAPGSN